MTGLVDKLVPQKNFGFIEAHKEKPSRHFFYFGRVIGKLPKKGDSVEFDVLIKPDRPLPEAVDIRVMVPKKS